MKTSPNNNSENKIIPIIVYQNINQIIKQGKWEFEQERNEALKQYRNEIDELLSNSNYQTVLKEFSTKAMKEEAIENNGKKIEILVNDLMFPSIFKYALERVWYYLMNGLQSLIDLLTLGYENVTLKTEITKNGKVIQWDNLLFKQQSNSKRYYSYISINRKVYKISTSELMILSLIQKSHMWETNIDENSYIVLSTHGIKDYSFPKISKWIVNHLFEGKFFLDIDNRRSFEEGIAIVKGSYFMNKIKLMNSLIEVTSANPKLMKKIILDTVFVRMIINEHCDHLNQSKMSQISSKISTMIEEFKLQPSNVEETIAIATAVEEPMKFLNEIFKLFSSNNLNEICELLEIPLKIRDHLIQIGCPSNAHDVINYFILTYFNSTNLFDHKLISLNLYFKMKMMIILNNKEITIDDHAAVTTKFGTQIPISIVTIIIEFIRDEFIDPQLGGYFEFDLTKFNLTVHFN